MGGVGGLLAGGNFWQGATTGLIVSGFNHVVHRNDPPGRKGKFSNKYDGAKLLGEMYLHCQFGNNTEYNVNASDLDFSSTSQKALGLKGMMKDEVRTINLFDIGVNAQSLAFGKIDLQYKGNNQFEILNNKFDFEYRSEASFKRNAATFMGGLIFGRLFNTPISLSFNLFFGGAYDVKFNGKVYIPK